jgi:hypothetical protein
MAQQDEIKIEILEDGTISIITDGISGQNHLSADKLIKRINELAGGETTCRKRTKMELGSSMQKAFEQHCHDGHVHQH